MVDDIVNGIFKWIDESEMPIGSKGSCMRYSHKCLHVHYSVRQSGQEVI